MHDAGSGVAVSVGAAVVVEAADPFVFGFACFEAESLEHAASSTAVTSRAINGVRRRRRIGARVCDEAVARTGSTIVDQAGWRVGRRSTTASNEVTRSTSRTAWDAGRVTSPGCAPAAAA